MDEFTNDILRHGIQVLPELERQLVQAIYSEGQTQREFCRDHRMSKMNFVGIETSAMAMLKEWLRANRVEALHEII